MRRYLPILLVSVFVLVTAIVGTNYLAGYAGQPKPDNYKSIIVYTTLPIEQAATLAETYEKSFNTRVNIVPVTEQDLLLRLKTEPQEKRGDILLAARPALNLAKQDGILVPYTSEQTDIIPNRFTDNERYWTGLWYDPVIFAVNQDFLKSLPQPPTKWNDLADTKMRLAITDFLAAEASADLYFTLAAVNGENATLAYFKKIHPQIVQYSKFLATPVRMVGMGEADIAVAVQSEALRYQADGFPIKIIYPEDQTSYSLVGAGLLKDANNTADAKHFIDWLIQDSAYEALKGRQFFFVPTNPATRMYKIYADKNIKLADADPQLTTNQRKKLLDNWVQNVRFSSR